MPADANTQLDVAQRFSLPPSLVGALSMQAPPKGLLATYGLDEKSATKDPNVVLTVLAHSLSEAFRQHGTLEQALSRVFSGDPNAYKSPTSSVGGVITGILSNAAKGSLQGWNGYKASQPEFLSQVGSELGKFMQATRDAGGIVSDGMLQQYNHQIATQNPIPRPTSHLTAPQPKGPESQQVESFAGQMKGLGIDVDHFLEHFPLVSSLRYKMMSSKTGLQDYAPVNGMDKGSIVQHVRNQPHNIYPHITSGEYADASDVATLHSREIMGRDPAPAEIARFATSGAKWGDIEKFYQNRLQKNAS